MAFIKVDSEGRITAASKTHHCGEGEIKVAIPEEIGLDIIHEYRFINGEFIYDPKSKPEQDDPKPTPESRIKAIEDQLAAYEAAYARGVNEA